MPIRYMGTKRHLASHVRAALVAQSPSGPALDLFSGMGAVAEALAPDVPVYANDFLGFAALINQARLRNDGVSASILVELALDDFEEQRERLTTKYSARLSQEEAALNEGQKEFKEWLERAPNAASTEEYMALSRTASASIDWMRYQLTTLYFSAGYFSTQQAIDLDSIRFAVDRLPEDLRQTGMAAWLVTAARLLNGPGHTAQYLRPNSGDAFKRIRRIFRRTAWSAFVAAATDLRPLGSPEWRSRSKTYNQEANDLLQALSPGEVGVVYADPPYTRDQYARFYHVYETLFRYDFPGAHGRGRVHTAERPMSSFSRRGSVVVAFTQFFQLARRLARPLILSYPSHGLLHNKGATIREVAAPWFKLESVLSLRHVHSTLGGSKGSAANSVEERIYSFVPS